MDGSNYLQTRNRCHLRKIIPFINEQMKEDEKMSMPAPLPTTPPTPAQPSPGPCTSEPPFHPQEADIGVSRMSGGREEGSLPSSSQSTLREPRGSQHANQPAIPILKLTRTDKNSDKWMVCKDHKPPSVIPDTMNTVQALSVTYPVSGSEGEGFTRT